MPPKLLRGPYFAATELHQLSNADLAKAREAFIERRLPNLDVLLEHRFGWMNAFFPSDATIVEFGAGAGFTQEYIRAPGRLMSDIEFRPWLDLVADATDPPFAEASVDVVICNQVLHHMALPGRFLETAAHVLRPGGHLLLNEPETSLAMRAILRLMRHEGWSYEVDPFDSTAICVDADNPWSGNDAVSQILFSDPARFEATFPMFKIVENSLTECLIFLFSGGVSSKTFTVPLPRFALSLIKGIDFGLVGLFPQLFALGRRVALQRV